jgi:hypothetical protein
MSVIGILFIILFGVLCLGWTVLLGFGIYRKRRGLAGGLVMIILGSIWAVPGIGIAGLAAFAIYQFSQWEPTETKSLDMATYEGETGTIALSYEGPATLTFNTTNAGEQVRLTGDNGGIIAPTGELKPYYFEGTRDGKGGTWTVSTYLGRRKTPLMVTPDEPVPLEVGPPLTASINTKLKANRQVSLDFTLRGGGTEQYSVRSPKGRPTPRFEIRDQRGEIVLSGKFSYG